MSVVVDLDRSTTDREDDEQDPEEPFRRAVAAADRGDLAEAAMQLLLACRRGAPMTLVALGLAARDCGERSFAIGVLSTAAKAGHPRAAVALAELLVRDGRPAGARAVLLDALHGGSDPEIHCALSVIAWQNGDVRARCRHCREARAGGWPSPSCSLWVRSPTYPRVRLEELLP
jgi:hypothetical protein